MTVRFRCKMSAQDSISAEPDGCDLAIRLRAGRLPYSRDNVVFLTPDDARSLAVELVRMADKIDGGKT